MLNSYNLKVFRTSIFEIAKGKQHGMEVGFYERNGSLKWEKNWKGGEQHGEEIHYYCWGSGGVSWKRNWINGKGNDLLKHN